MLATTRPRCHRLRLQADALSIRHPEPEWIARAADEFRIRLGADRLAARRDVPGAWFDEAKADHIIKMWPEWFSLTVGRFAGKPFRLSLWQEIIVRLLIGWKHPVEASSADSARRSSRTSASSASCGCGCRARTASRNSSRARAVLLVLRGAAARRGLLLRQERGTGAHRLHQDVRHHRLFAGDVGRRQVHATDLWCQEFKTAFCC
jgi:hypothetical protein